MLTAHEKNIKIFAHTVHSSTTIQPIKNSCPQCKYPFSTQDLKS